MPVEILTSADYRPMAWKNGGGSTLELFRHTAPGCGDFAVRLSIADVHSSGPFSHFENTDRQLLLLSGEGVRLRFADGRVQTLSQPLQPIAFAGDMACDSQLLDGPVRDFNLMVHRHFGRGQLSVIRLDAGQSISLSPAPLAFYYLLSGELLLSEQNLPLISAQTLVLHQPQFLALYSARGASLIAAEVHPHQAATAP